MSVFFAIKGSFWDNIERLDLVGHVGIIQEGSPVLKTLEVGGFGISEAESTLRKVVGVELPDWLDNPSEIDDESIAALDASLSKEGLPTRTLIFCRLRDSEEEVVMLFTPKGVSPRKALDEIKNAAQSRLDMLN